MSYPVFLVGLFQVVSDIIEDVPDVVAGQLHGTDDDDRNACRNQSIFDGSRGRLVPQKMSDSPGHGTPPFAAVGEPHTNANA